MCMVLNIDIVGVESDPGSGTDFSERACEQPFISALSYLLTAVQAWKTVPWEDDPGSKMPAEYLIDLLSDIAGILADLSIIPPSELRSTLEHAFEYLNAWWREWISNHPHACEEYPANPTCTTTHDSRGLMFPTLLRYSTIWHAHAISLHATARLLLLHIWTRALPQATRDLSDVVLDEPNSSPLLGISSKVTGLAHEVIRSIDYCQEQSRRFVGTFCVILPQDIAYGSLDPASREARALTGGGPCAFFESKERACLEVGELQHTSRVPKPAWAPGLLARDPSACERCACLEME